MSRVLPIDSSETDSEVISEAVAVLSRGGLIAYPTETVYGLGADATSEAGVQRIFDIKGRDPAQPVSVMLPDLESIERIATALTPAAKRLIAEFLPGPLTLIMRARKECEHLPIVSRGRIGVRMPEHRVCLALTRTLGKPVTSTSANLSGQRSAVSATEALGYFGDKLDLILDGGPSPSLRPSTVVDVTAEKPKIVRIGMISTARIAKALESVEP